MNDEIFKRLQDQCWIYHTHPDMIDDKGRPCGFDTKKFAELIVRECINRIEQNRSSGENTDSWTITRDMAFHQMKQDLAEHFGVEE